MLLGSFIPENDLGELAKLPQLVEHYEYHHSAAGGGLNISQFLAEHYGAGTKHYAGCTLSPRHQQDHHNLPLRCHHGCVTFSFVVASATRLVFVSRPEMVAAPVYRAAAAPPPRRATPSAPVTRWASLPEPSLLAPPDAVCPA